jgi:hypothetical protein
VTKQVVVTSIQDDGTINTATSSKLQARLTPKPTTTPTTQANAAATMPTTTVASTKPSQAEKMNFLAGKEITSATLTADGPERVEIKSEQYADGNVLLRALNLYATTVTTNRAPGRLEVPVPGEMLVRDYRPPEARKDAAAAPGAKGGPTLGNGRGNTAFKWSKSLTYDEAQHQAVMNGDVVVIHNPITKEGEPFNLWADTLTAQMEADPTTKSASQPAAGGAVTATRQSREPKQDKMRLKRVLATGKVKVESQRNEHRRQRAFVRSRRASAACPWQRGRADDYRRQGKGHHVDRRRVGMEHGDRSIPHQRPVRQGSAVAASHTPHLTLVRGTV